MSTQKRWTKSQIRKTFAAALHKQGIDAKVGGITWLSKTWCKPLGGCWKGERLEDVMFRVAKVEISIDGKTTSKLIHVERCGNWRIS